MYLLLLSHAMNPPGLGSRTGIRVKKLVGHLGQRECRSVPDHGYT